jgi:primary-amine oxidase
MTRRHPLDLLTPEEVTAAVAVVRARPDVAEGARTPFVRVAEPSPAELDAWAAGAEVPRRVRIMVVRGTGPGVDDAVVDLDRGAVVSWDERPDDQPALLVGEALQTVKALRADPRFQEAIRRRGIEDVEQVQIDPWPPGRFGHPSEVEHRLARCICYWREKPAANGYARPIEGLLVIFDMARAEIVEIIDTGVVPLPPGAGSYLPDAQPSLRTDLRPLEIHQPEGPSWTVEGNLVRWQKWQLRVGWDPFEGLVLHEVGYEDGGRLRPILRRASISEMVVPYGDVDPMHNWKNAFDAGEWGLGRMTTSLKLGCDCLGEIHYFDVVNTFDGGEPYVVENAICLHEEDYGILWKHVDLHRGGTSEVRRSRRLVVSCIATVGNYEYGFYWYFYLDGTIQLEVKLTGIMSMMAVDPAAPADGRSARMVAPGLAAPLHQHLFNARLDVAVDGAANTVHEVDVVPRPAGPDNPLGNVFVVQATPLRTEREARRDVAPQRSRTWRVVNPNVRNGVGEPVAYRLIPGSTPTLLADASSSIARRAGFARHNLWVTPYDPEQRRAAGEYPNQCVGAGLPVWTEADRPIEDTDIVVWYTFGVTHVPRPEDFPVMPVEYAGFLFQPFGFFDQNPALDVPPVPAHCHSEGPPRG